VSGTLTVACVQDRFGPDPAENLGRIAAGIREAGARGAQLVLLPELHNGPYFCQVLDPAWMDRAEPVPGPTTAALGTLAKELRIVVVGSVFERRAPGIYHNTAVVLDADGTLAGCYRKAHVPDDPGFQEKFYFTPGEGPLVPVRTAAGALGTLVCWDQWYPEAARAMALAGAQVLCYPTAIARDPREDPAESARQWEAWLTVQRGHAVANHLPLMAANRIGTEALPGGVPGGLEFWGRSFIAGPQGELLAQAPADAPAVITAVLDPARTEALRRTWPFFRDRRTDLYAPLLRRWSDRD
jgi:N-carbamoylputrescine amidase